MTFIQVEELATQLAIPLYLRMFSLISLHNAQAVLYLFLCDLSTTYLHIVIVHIAIRHVASRPLGSLLFLLYVV